MTSKATTRGLLAAIIAGGLLAGCSLPAMPGNATTPEPVAAAPLPIPAWARTAAPTAEPARVAEGSVRVGSSLPAYWQPALLADDTEGGVYLPDLKNQWTVLFFYPKDFTFVCPTELRELAAFKQQFTDAGVNILPISADTLESHRNWRGDLGGDSFDFTWLSDPNGELAKAFGIWDAEKGVSLRGSFLVDPNGVVQSMTVNNSDIGRSAAELLRTAQAAQTGEMCPANWHPGDATITAPAAPAALPEEQN